MTTVYEKVEALRAKFPDLNRAELCKKAGVKYASYNSAAFTRRERAKKAAPAGKKTAKKKKSKVYKRLVVEDAAPARGEKPLTVIVGTPAQIREALGGLL